MKLSMYILFTLIMASQKKSDENITKSDDSTGHNTKANLNQDLFINYKNA